MDNMELEAGHLHEECTIHMHEQTKKKEHDLKL